MKKNYLILIFFLLVPLLITGEERKIEFEKPLPFTDYEFQELQRTFLKNRKVQLAAFRQLPLNQYPEEFLLELIDKIKKEVRQEVQEELIQILQDKLEQKRRTALEKVSPPEKEKKSQYPTDEKRKIPLRKEKITMSATREQKEKAKKEEKRVPKSVEKTKSDANQIIRFSLNNNTSFIGINALSKLLMNVDVKAASSIRYVDVTIYVKNLENQMVYLLKRFAMYPISRTRSFSFLWQYPNIPFGKYKPYVIARFYDKNRKLINEDFQFWGNSSSPKIYILFKN